MNKEITSRETLNPRLQTKLFGFDKYFETFINFKKYKNIPKVVLFSGNKGIGKNTFTFHLINYFLSESEEFNYSTNDMSIDKRNRTFNLILNNLHPNFYLIDCNENKKKIEIDQIRLLKNFINKTTYLSGNKIILINGVENLNVNSANAILKITEEPTLSTFFFLIHDSSFPIIKTIKSRCINFKIFFNFQERINILSSLLKQYNFSSANAQNLIQTFPYDSPGNIISYLSIMDSEKIEIESNLSLKIIYLIDKYLINKKKEYLYFIKILIENFFYKLYLRESSNILIIKEKFDLIYKINQMNIFNLDEKNIFYDVKKTIINYEK